MKKLTFLFIAAMFLTTAVFADIRLPDKPKPTPAATPVAKEIREELNIKVNQNYKEPTLRIPKAMLKDLRAALENVDDQGAVAGTTGGFNITPTQTLMSGLFLSLALAFGGVWLFKSKPLGKSPQVAAGLIVAAVFGSCATLIYANAAPPPLQGLDGSLFSDKMRSRWNGATGTVKVEITDEKYRSSSIELIIPRGDDKKSDE